MSQVPVLKHQEFILAVKADVFKFYEGFNRTSSYNTLLEVLRPFTIIAQRAGLEKNPDYLQLLPYILVKDDTIPSEEKFLMYQRTKQVGEERLGGKFSIGVGGHVELLDMFGAAGTDWGTKIPVDKTLVLATHREVLEETNIEDEITQEVLQEAFKGFIIDRGDEVGKVHLGLVFVLKKSQLKTNLIRITDPDLVDCGFKSVAEVKEHDLERWSSILLENSVSI